MNGEVRPTEEAAQARLKKIMADSSYRLAYLDADYIRREDLRPLRLELELLKPEMLLEEKGIKSTIVVFGGTQIKDAEESARLLAEAEAQVTAHPHDEEAKRRVQVARNFVGKSHYYDECRRFARIVCENARHLGDGQFVIKTGGGPGIMEAANRAPLRWVLPQSG